jgi:hypothetical protein
MRVYDTRHESLEIYEQQQGSDGDYSGGSIWHTTKKDSTRNPMVGDCKGHARYTIPLVARFKRSPTLERERKYSTFLVFQYREQLVQ